MPLASFKGEMIVSLFLEGNTPKVDATPTGNGKLGYNIFLNGGTTVICKAPADESLLKERVFVRLIIDMDRTRQFPPSVAKLEIISFSTKSRITGFFPIGEETSRPITYPKPGKYQVIGRIVSYKNGTLRLQVGPKTLATTLANDAQVSIHTVGGAGLLMLAEKGDTIRGRGIEYSRRLEIRASAQGSVLWRDGMTSEVNIERPNVLTAQSLPQSRSKQKRK